MRNNRRGCGGRRARNPPAKREGDDRCEGVVPRSLLQHWRDARPRNLQAGPERSQIIARVRRPSLERNGSPCAGTTEPRPCLVAFLLEDEPPNVHKPSAGEIGVHLELAG